MAMVREPMVRREGVFWISEFRFRKGYENLTDDPNFPIFLFLAIAYLWLSMDFLEILKIDFTKLITS